MASGSSIGTGTMAGGGKTNGTNSGQMTGEKDNGRGKGSGKILKDAKAVKEL
eukprot:CAMPEP_0197458864 /NCGR_PEP_ID=MMETSP1175-20131217/49829_1 /TAXON_ID=1003142 /ORGANISM="Triceratium dubium, Strain CCMP147" /LENGTH=51 /DNA_ID=CAMNT_0042993595 /DNA_START=1 /DNA_END=152 /DNA_ORIENTATION=+